MKKFLLSTASLGTALSAQAQELFKADFEAGNIIGNFITGPSGTSTVLYNTQSLFTGWSYVATTDMAASRYQIETDASTNASQVLKITGWPIAAGTTGTKANMLYNTASFNPKWVNRTPGNDVLELDFDLWIPAATTSKNFLQLRLSNSSKYPTTFYYTPASNALEGWNFTSANALVSAPGAKTTTLPRETWQHVTITYNTVNGKIKQRFGNFDTPESTTGNLIQPAFLELILGSGTAATADTPAADFKIDNIIIKATQVSTLGTKEIYRENNDVAVYLNQNQLEVSAKVAVKTLAVYNLAGQLVASSTGNSVDIAALGKGTYLAKYSDNKNTYSKRFVK
jgi:hypothetical protein